MGKGLISGTDRVNGVSPATEVIVVVDVHSQLSAPLEIAVLMAAARKAKLHGLCVEDPDLWQVAELPFTREVTLLGGKARAFEGQQLRRDMNFFAGRFKNLLAERAEQSSLPWSISTIRGHKQAMGLGKGAQSDLLVMGQPGPAQTARQSLVKILVLENQHEMILPTLDIVLQRNENRGAEVLLLEGNEDAAQKNFFENHLQKYPYVQLKSVSEKMVPQLCIASLLPLDYVIGSRQQDSALLIRVMQLATCPVILFG